MPKPPLSASQELSGSTANLLSRNRTSSLRSFYASDRDDSMVVCRNRSRSVGHDFCVDSRGHVVMDSFALADLSFGRMFHRRVQRIASHVNMSDDSNEDLEVPRSAFTTVDRNMSKLVNHTLSEYGVADSSTTVQSKANVLVGARVQLIAARAAIEMEPKLVEKTYNRMAVKSKKQSHHIGANGARFCGTATTSEMKFLIDRCRSDEALAFCLLYDRRYDSKWKNNFTDQFADPSERKKLDNRQGWVMPLKRLCDKTQVDSKFFTSDRTIELDGARREVYRQRLLNWDYRCPFVREQDPSAFDNFSLPKFMNSEFDPIAHQARLAMFVEHLRADRDRTRVTGEHYNGIKLGKRMFGPAKVEVFESSVVGGMERRLEILDNQVNHIPFDHHFSDNNRDKCRNKNIHCCDGTRVELAYPVGHRNSFIHANYVKGGPLFNEFILTQAPMDNTIEDFWRMVWQERTVLIYMLISRKDSERCASYWPRKISTSVSMCGLTITNVGIDIYSDPLFRITHLRITGPGNEVLHVEHFQGDFNNSSNLRTPLNLLKLARTCKYPVIVHDHLGISRAACLLATEIAICSLIHGPTYKHLVQQSVQFLRSKRPFCIETPMQYIFIHRCVEEMFQHVGGRIHGFYEDYQRWLSDRANRLFLEDLDSPIPGYRLLSPRVDPDVLRQVRRPPRPNFRREAPDCVGEWPILLEQRNTRRLIDLDL